MSTEATEKTADGEARIDFQTSPDNNNHWNLSVDVRVARLALDVD